MDEEKTSEQGPLGKEHMGIPTPSSSLSANRCMWGALAVLAVLLIITGITLDYGFHQKSYVRQLQDQNAQVNSTLGRTRTEVDTLTSKLNNLEQALAAQQEARAQAEAERVSHHHVVRGARSHRLTAEERRLQEIQSELAAHQKQIASTQQDLQNTKTEFASKLQSTTDDLNSSIAHNHNELVALEKKGERNYYEFDLPKSKEYSRVGPVGLSLRKANVKHEYYDAMVIVNDNPLKKKHVGLYEPVYFYADDSRQPMELVVNRISKDRIHGYVSAPKYKPSELAAIPGSDTGSGSASNPSASVSPNDATGSNNAASLIHRPEQPQ